MKVLAITATCGRHTCLERSVRFFLDQDYSDCVQLIYQNSKVEQRLNSNLGKNIILVNQAHRTQDRRDYTCLGEIYNDIIKFIPADVEVVTFWDDDDLFLPNHIREGVEGLVRGGKTAYKPMKSFYKEKGRVALVTNVLEPSMFIKVDHIKKYGFSNTTSDQHMSWVRPLIETNDIFVDTEGVPTYVCDWSQEISTFKTSGDPNNKNNFVNYHKSSADHGDGIITPAPKSVAEKYYSQFNSYAR